MEYCEARRGDTHITEPVQRYVYPLFFLLFLKEISSISPNTTINTPRFTDRNQTIWKVEFHCTPRGIHISLNQPRDMCIPCFFFSRVKEISAISSNTTINTTRLKTGIKQRWKGKVEYYAAGRGDTHITKPAQRYVYHHLSSFLLFELSLAEWNFVSHTYLTRLATHNYNNAR